MKPDKHSLGAAGILVAASGLIALTWFGTLQATRADRQQNAASVQAALANQALTFSEQIDQQIMAIDQALRILVMACESNPTGFDLAAWHKQAVALSGLSRDIILADATGVVRQSSLAEAVNQTVTTQDFFQALSQPTAVARDTFIGPATTGPVLRQWHMNVARALHHPDGSFAGAIDVDYRTASITDMFNQVELGPGALEAVVSLNDGRLQAASGSASFEPAAAFGDTPVFAAIQHDHHGIWIGPTPLDGLHRIHAFRTLPHRSLAVIVAVDQAAAMQPAAIWQRQAYLLAACITALLAGIGLLLLRSTRQARRRLAELAADKAVLASANAQLEQARAMATAKAEQLEATLGGISDGVSMFDARMRLVEWNDRFAEVAGVPPDILRVGVPMEHVLYAQAVGGQFGRLDSPDAEVARRMVRLRSGPHGVVQRQRPDGHTIELRRKSLPEGGFVTLYADITEHKRTEAALREAQAQAEVATAVKSRFVAMVSHEIRTPLNALLNTLQLLADSPLGSAQRSLLAMAVQSGEALSSLINDILEMAQIEAGKLMIRPTLFDLPQLMAGAAEVLRAEAAERGITLRVSVAPALPVSLVADAGRLRQVLLNLLSNAVKYTAGNQVLLQAEAGRSAADAATILVRDLGPVIETAARMQLFQPFSRLGQAIGDAPIGAGLGLSICQELMTLMGGTIGWEPWSTPDGRQGNAFWLTLPLSAVPLATRPQTSLPTELPQPSRPAGDLPAGAAAAAQVLRDPPPSDASTPDCPNADFPNPASPALPPQDLRRRPLPRTRILLVDDVAANQIVTATLLRRAGHMVDVAASGPAALEAVQKSSYDLVFMDIFMPGMNGYETASAIRALPEPIRSMPIVALTADASPAGEIVIQASGMNGIMAKPVDLAALLDVLEVHVWSGNHSAAAPSTSSQPTTESRPPRADPAQPVLAADRILELRSNLPPQTFVSLIEECLVDLDHRMPALRRASSTGSIGAITAQAHAMVGMAGGYGMAALETSLRAVMAAARSGDTDALGPVAIARIEADLAAAAHALRELLQDVPA